MFKILILQRYFNLSDDQTEFQIKDRLSFMDFLNLELSDKIPDAKTIWLIKGLLGKNGLTEKLFDLFTETLNDKGIIAKEGSMIDASFVDVPKQRNNREDNTIIKEGSVPISFAENKNKLAQKDTDARWTTKNNEKHFGYKNHINADKETKLINKYSPTNASTHDSVELEI
jgi:transposase, IS5 family